MLVSVMITLLAACGGGGGSSSVGDSGTGSDAGGGAGGDTGGDTGGNPTDGSDTAACGVEAQKTFVKRVADDWYLWYDEMAVVDPVEFDDAQAFLNALTAPLSADKRDPGFSYLTTKQADAAALGSGAYIGFGFRYGFDTANRLRFADVFEGGPASDADIERSDIVVAIDTGNGFETTEQLAARNATNEELFGPPELGVERAFRIQQGSDIREVTLVKRELVTPALAGQPTLIERDGLSPVGYVHMRAFINSAQEPLTEMAQTFANAGVTDVIIDFRYNGGGLLSVADTMMDLLAGYAPPGEASYKIQVNDQHPEFNGDRSNWGVFDVLPDTAYPIRIAFITSGYTASASELVINGLDPHIEVVLVGGNTFGKQVGQGRWDMYENVEGLEREDCDVALRLTAFEIVNGENQGGYHQVGLNGTGRFTLCRGEDDLSHPLGDAREGLVATALDWFGSGACPSSSGSGRGVPLANERAEPPPWLPIEYIPERVDESVR